MSREALQSALGLKDRKSFRERYLGPALEDGLIEMTRPAKPRSRLQKYRLTEKGRQLLAGQAKKLLREATPEPFNRPALTRHHSCLVRPSLGNSINTSALLSTPTRARVRILFSQGRAMNHMAVAPPTK